MQELEAKNLKNDTDKDQLIITPDPKIEISEKQITKDKKSKPEVVKEEPYS